MSNFKLQTAHPLIQSEQTFVLDRKIISVHSIDRDYKKWPNSNNFGVDLGEAFHNVQSLRLINYSFPTNNYTFSKAYQNTKFSFTYVKNLNLKFENEQGGGTPFDNINKVLSAISGVEDPANQKDNWINSFPEDVNIYSKDVSDNFIRQTIPATGSTTDPSWNNTDFDKSENIVQIRWEPSPIQITIPEGSYSAENLAKTIESLMNKAIFNISADTKHNCFPVPGKNDGQLDYAGLTKPPTNPDSNWYRNPNDTSKWGLKPFVVYYDNISNKIIIGAKEGKFTLNFSKQEIYDADCDVNKAIFHQYTKWGLPSYLGFDKEEYKGVETDVSNTQDYYIKNIGGLYLHHDIDTPWLIPSGIENLNIGNDNNQTLVKKDNTIVRSVSAINNLDIQGEDAIYIEVDRYNNIDEIYPYSERTGHLYNNDLGHRVNGSFAKIPLSTNNFRQANGVKNTMIINIFHSDPPIQRIDRLRFKFRYHDGRLVDFKNLPFSLTLELNMLKDEQTRGKTVRVPHLYNL